MKKITLHPPDSAAKTEIHFGQELLVSTCHALSRRGAILVDGTIAKTHGAQMQKILGYDLIDVPSGENQKNRETKQALEDELFKRRLDRDSVIVAVGGGVTTDLVGYLAATYMRGVPLVLVPTTLLGMVDAAIGGKTGVNTSFGKNLVGTFYLPKAVFIDVEMLKTLPDKEVKNGLSEILKYGLIANGEIWKRCSRWREELEFLIRASVACKVKVVEQDFEEKTGLRRILNYGHTVGHALELLSDYKMAHGEAVALGCMAESYLSHQLGYLPAAELEQILGFYRKLGYAFKETEGLLEAMRLDKKAKGGEVRFVLIDRIGHCLPFDGEYCRAVNQTALEKLIAWINND